MSDITIIGPDNEVIYRRTLAPNEDAHLHLLMSINLVPTYSDIPRGRLVVDVSKWQEDIDAQKLHDEGGVTDALIKCTDGLGVDKKFRANWSNFKRAGINRGATHFWRTLDAAGKRLSGRAQAEHFMDTLGTGDRGERHPSLDYEPAEINQPHATLAELEAFETLMPDDYRLYSSVGMWAGYRLKRAKVWAADYTEPLNVMQGYTLADVVLWQVGVTRLPGIDGWVDVNMAVSGTAPDFPNWAYKHTPSTGPDKDKLYKCTAADKTAVMEFCDKPRGTVHTRRVIPGMMDVWKVSFLDAGWVCVVTGAREWWTPVGNVRL